MADNNTVCSLSKEATDEILGGNLSFIIAFGANGEVVQYLPYGVTNIDPEMSFLVGNTDSLTISLNTNDNPPTEFTPVGLMSTRKATYWCFRGGRWVTCSNPC